MNLFKISTLALALALTGWVACSSSNNNTDVPSIGTGGTIAAGGAVGSGGAGGAIGTDAAVSTGGAGVDAANMDAPISSGPSDAGVDGPASSDASGTADALGGEVGNPIDICTGLTPQQCHLAIIQATPDSTVSALDPGANPPVSYPTCSAQ
jgi:hypothetical protein